MVITPEQCRAARALLGWTQPRLAEAAALSLPTISSFERNASNPTRANLRAIRIALEEAGIVFIPAHGDGSGGIGPGVRLRTLPDG